MENNCNQMNTYPKRNEKSDVISVKQNMIETNNIIAYKSSVIIAKHTLVIVMKENMKRINGKDTGKEKGIHEFITILHLLMQLVD